MESDTEEYCVIGDARRQSFFFAHVVQHELQQGPTLCSGSDLKTILQSLDPAIPVFSSELLPQFGGALIRFPSALVLAKLAQERRHSFFLPPLEPIYLREPHITMPK
jgi:tRNA A37 threonylcarbamoyladenosine modification protein TsaB